MEGATDHPSYYIQNNIEAIDVIEAWELDFHLGNVVKYICRCGRKTNDKLTDLLKARWYLDRYILNMMKDDKKIKREDFVTE